MPDRATIAILVGAGIAAFSLLLLIISVGIPLWLDDGNGNTIGLFQQCFNSSVTTTTNPAANGGGCMGANRVTQGGLSVFGILLLSFGVISGIGGFFLRDRMPVILFISLGLLYFASMFVMAAYATWGEYSRDENSWYYPIATNATIPHTSMGNGYNLCVAAHYFLWTALTIFAFGVGHLSATGPDPNAH
jgi:hypothetical protein